ncbi:MAG: extracellular solute-binding protein, partial [Anaerolineales bacterium]|nr:extracellular solute-binding protein [Anaerolineales bacterium]
DLSDFYGPAVTLNQFPEKTVGLPLGLFPSFVFYNLDLFDAAGLDYPTHDYNDTSWTMDKLRDMAMELTLDVNGNNANSSDFDAENIAQWGFDDSWTDGRGWLTRFGAENIGRPTTDDYKTAMANSEEWVYGMQWLSDGIWEDHFIPDYAGQEAYYAVGGDPFGGSLVAIFYSHTWFFPEGLVDLPFDYDIAPAPFNQKGTRIARIHADTFTIPQEAENKEAAWEVLKWLTAPEQIVDVCLIYGCVPARQSVTAEFESALAERYPGMDYDVVFEAINYLDNPNHESYVPQWGRVNDAMNNAMDQVFSGVEMDGQVVLDQANDEIQAILDEYWSKQ